MLPADAESDGLRSQPSRPPSPKGAQVASTTAGVVRRPHEAARPAREWARGGQVAAGAVLPSPGSWPASIGELLGALGAAGAALAMLDAAGQVTAMTAALERLLAADADRVRVWDAARVVAVEVRRQAEHASRSRAAEPGAFCAAREVATAAGAYRVAAARLGGGHAAWAVLLVERRVGMTASALPTAERAGPPAEPEPTDELSPREWQVAHLLVDGHTTATAAAALGISVHTARHHAERVYQKLGVRSRAALGARLGGVVGRDASKRRADEAPNAPVQR